MLRVDPFIHNLISFHGLFLEIDQGLSALTSLERRYPHDKSLQLVQIPEVFVNESWVVRDTEKILWLPSEHWANCSAFRGNVLVLGHINGRVTFMQFD
jgi:hypothetical protein